eukprot:755749-Hanusia_phi.AAC.1
MEEETLLSASSRRLSSPPLLSVSYQGAPDCVSLVSSLPFESPSFTTYPSVKDSSTNGLRTVRLRRLESDPTIASTGGGLGVSGTVTQPRGPAIPGPELPAQACPDTKMT